MSPCRVLYVINGFNKGGAEIGLQTMLEHGFLRGCDVRVIGLHEGAPELRAAIGRLVGPENLVLASDGPKLTLAGLWRGFRTLRATLRTFRPHTVVLSLRQTNIVGRLALLDHRAIRCIAFEHIAKLEAGRLTTLYAALLWLLSPRVDEVWADCRVTLEGARRYHRGRPRERVVPLFVADAQAPRKTDYRLGTPARIVTAGRLIPRKRVDVLLQALTRLRGDGHDCTLTIFGDGPDRPRLMQLAESLGLGASVTFAGFRPRWYETAREHDLCVHLSDEEGFCIVVAEAMMVGLPVIASPVGGVLEYARDGLDAIHAPVPPKPDDVARQISGLLADAGRRRALGEAAAERIADTYGTVAAVAVYDSLTRTLAQSAAGPAASGLFGGHHGRA